MTEDEIEKELRDAQAAMAVVREVQQRRQRAVAAALEAKWSKYRIAATLGVKAPTVDSIVKAIERDTASQVREKG